MRKVATISQAHPQHGVTWLHQRHIDSKICSGTGVWLDISIVGFKQRFRYFDRNILNDVNMLTPAIISLARVPLGVLIRQNRALRLQD